MGDEEKKEVKTKEYYRLDAERRDFKVTSAAPPAIPQPEPIKKEDKKK